MNGYYIFSKEIADFLMSYQPADEHITSHPEIYKIGRIFNLINISDEMRQEIRNNVVKFYNRLMDNEIIYDENGKYNGRTDQWWKYSTAMMSVTTAIDYYKYL